MPTESLYTLYPEISPYHATWIDRPQGHKIYVELSGNPQGKPIIFLHGGPGGALTQNKGNFLIQNITKSFFLIKGAADKVSL